MNLFCFRSISEDTEMVKKPRKRLAMYRTLPDGTVEKEYISYDDPILAKVDIVSKSYLPTKENVPWNHSCLPGADSKACRS